MKRIVEEEGSENETIARKIAKRRKRVLRNNRVSLSELEGLGIEFVELVVLRMFQKVKTNVFKSAPPNWKLEDS